MAFKLSDNELLAVRNKIFEEEGISELNKKGFVKAPFSTANYGRNNLGDFTYELCRLANNSQLEYIITHIAKGDSYIQISLNMFKLTPVINSIDKLEGRDGLNYHLPPTSLTAMRLRFDEYNVPPIIWMLFSPEHKLGHFSTEEGFVKKEKKLKALIQNDMAHIDNFVQKWHQKHAMNTVSWDGKIKL
jgi:hypothetical protein